MLGTALGDEEQQVKAVSHRRHAGCLYVYIVAPGSVRDMENIYSGSLTSDDGYSYLATKTSATITLAVADLLDSPGPQTGKRRASPSADVGARKEDDSGDERRT